MAIAKLLGFDLCPRLRDLAARKLYLPRGFTVPDGLELVTVRRVSLAAIERGWDELLCLAASIRSARISATLALQRFGSAAQGDPLHRAAERLGRLLRTVFLCDHIGPAHFSYIDFCGTMEFGVGKFAAALIQRTPGQATRMAS